MITFTADRHVLTAAISRAAQGAPPRPARPVYAGMLFDTRPVAKHVVLTTSDSQVTFRVTMPAVTPVYGGSFILPVKMLQEISRYWTGSEVTVSYEPDPKPGEQKTATITAGRSTFTVAAVDGDEFPQNDMDTPDLFLTIDGTDFADVLKRVVPAASDADPVLATVNVTLRDKLWIVATDRYRMAIMNPDYEVGGMFATAKVEDNVLVAANVMEKFARTIPKEGGSVRLGWNDKLVSIQCEGMEVTAPTIGGKYLKWESIASVGQNLPTAATVDTAELSRGVRMASVAAGSEGAVELTFREGEVTVAATGDDGENASDTILADYSGDEVSFKLGHQMILDGLAGCGEMADFAWQRAVFVRSEGFGYMMQPRRD